MTTVSFSEKSHGFSCDFFLFIILGQGFIADTFLTYIYIELYKLLFCGEWSDDRLSISILFSYILLGFTLAAPIGPVNSARLDKGIKNGFWHAWIVGVGSMIADGFFMLLVYLGMVQFLEVPIIQIFLWLFGAFILIYSGVEDIINVNSITLADS